MITVALSSGRAWSMRGLSVGKALTSMAKRVKPGSKADWGMIAGGTLLGAGVGTAIVHDRNSNNRDMRNLHHMLMPTPDRRNQTQDEQELLRILNRQTNVTIPGLTMLTPRWNRYSNIQNVRTIGNRKLFEADRNGITQTFVIGSDPHGTDQVGMGTLVNLNEYWRHRQNYSITHEEALRRSSILGNGQGRNWINQRLVPDETHRRGDIALQLVNGNVNMRLLGSMRQGDLEPVTKRFENITLENGQNMRDFLRNHADAFQVPWNGTPTDLAVASFRQNGTSARATVRFNTKNGSVTIFNTDAQGRFLGQQHIEEVAPENVKARLDVLMKDHTPVAR